MASDTVYVGQLICDSTTPPPDRGFYKINDTTTGHVGKLVMSDPVSGKESVALTATLSDWGSVFDDTGASAARAAVPKPLHQIRTVMLYGDSGVQHGDRFIDVGSIGLVNDGSGTCSAYSFQHNIPSGTTGYIVNSSDPYWAEKKVITRIDTNNFSFPLDARAAPTLASTIYPSGAVNRLILVLNHRPNRASIFHALNAKLGHRWVCLSNRAANGKTARDMLLDVEREVINANPRPDAVWIAPGTNDVRILSETPEIAASRVKALLTKIINAGIFVFYQPWMPDDARDATAATYRLAKRRYDRIISDWIRRNPHIHYVIRHEVQTDPTSPYGYAYANYLQSDGLHDAAAGAEVCALANYNELLPTLGKRIRHLPSSAADALLNDNSSRNRFQNPLFLITTGGMIGAGGTAGNLPSFVTVNRTGSGTFAGVSGGTNYYAARTVANDGDNYGNNVVVQWSPAASGEELTIDVVGYNSGYAVGDVLRVGSHVKSKTQGNNRPKMVATYHRVTQDGVTYNNSLLGDAATAAAIGLPNDQDEVHFTERARFVVTGGVSINIMRIWIIASGPDVITVEVGRPLIEQIPAAVAAEYF